MPFRVQLSSSVAGVGLLTLASLACTRGDEGNGNEVAARPSAGEQTTAGAIADDTADANATDDDAKDSPTNDLDSLPGGAGDETPAADGAPRADRGAAISGSGAETTLDIYLVDVEGGHATLIRFPTGQTLLVDSGVAGDRDPPRILDVLSNVIGATRLDYFLTTHYDADHVGGAVDVAAGIPVGRFMDHGDEAAPESYLALANAGERVVIQAGDALDVGAVHLDFVSSARELITEPLAGAGAANPHCEGALDKPGDDENAASVGFVLRFGSFDFLNLADLLWNQEQRLVCPVNLLGKVDVYLTTHHGLERSGAPQLVHAVEPLVALMNNGARKGGGGQTWRTLSSAPGALDVWQMHLALEASDSENPAHEQIANLDSGQQHAADWLRVTVDASGAFRVFNSRNGFSKSYQAR